MVQWKLNRQIHNHTNWLPIDILQVIVISLTLDFCYNTVIPVTVLTESEEYEGAENCTQIFSWHLPTSKLHFCIDYKYCLLSRYKTAKLFKISWWNEVKWRQKIIKNK